MAWLVAGNIRGPQGLPGPKGDTGSPGLTGPAGETGPQGSAGPQGPQGLVGSQGPQGPVGPQGTAGVSLDINGNLANYAALLAVSNPQEGDAYIINKLLYYYDGDSWTPDGQGIPFEGPQGIPGAQGATGPQGERGLQGDPGTPGADGATGPTGPAGATGPQGSQGTRGSLLYTGVGSPSGISGVLAGDVYIDTQSGDLYQFS